MRHSQGAGEKYIGLLIHKNRAWGSTLIIRNKEYRFVGSTLITRGIRKLLYYRVLGILVS